MLNYTIINQPHHHTNRLSNFERDATIFNIKGFFNDIEHTYNASQLSIDVNSDVDEMDQIGKGEDQGKEEQGENNGDYEVLNEQFIGKMLQVLHPFL